MEKRISKNGIVKANNNVALNLILKNEDTIERMVDYAEAATCSGKSDEQVRSVLRKYVRGMLEAAKA
jgi:hypothetical protein